MPTLEQVQEKASQYQEIEQMIYEYSQELDSIKEFPDSDPVASFRFTVASNASMEVSEGGQSYTKKRGGRKIGYMNLYNQYGEIPTTITRKQAEIYLGARGIHKSILDEKGKVRTAYILDDTAASFGMTDYEFLQHLDKIHHLKERQSDLKVMISNAKEELQEIGKPVVKVQTANNDFTAMVFLAIGAYIITRYRVR